MKKSIVSIRIMSLMLLLTLLESACFHRQIIVERPASDDVYNNQRLNQAPELSTTVSYQAFYDELSPYGSWMDNPAYGYVWRPRVGVDFHPYATHGYWVMTNYGWTWVSDFSWGWAAFHYGRWAYEPMYGWLWVPDNIWGPAWVDWRESPDYFGWAPLGPYVNISVGLVCPYDHYRFIPRRHFTDRHLYNYYTDWHQNTIIIKNTTVINETHTVNNRKYYYGPRKDRVETAVGRSIKPAEVSDNSKPNADIVENDRVKVYRPRFENIPKDAPNKPAPKRLESPTDLQPIPNDKRLTPTPRREKPQDTEGGENRPQNPDTKIQPIDENKQRPKVNQPRRDEVPKVNPDVKTQPIDKNKQPPKVNQPRRNEVPKVNPDVKIQPIDKNKQPPKVNQPRRNEVPKVNPPKNEKKEKVKTAPTKENGTTPPKKRNGN